MTTVTKFLVLITVTTYVSNVNSVKPIQYNDNDKLCKSNGSDDLSRTDTELVTGENSPVSETVHGVRCVPCINQLTCSHSLTHSLILLRQQKRSPLAAVTFRYTSATASPV